MDIITEELVQRIRTRGQILIWYLTAAFGLSAFAITTKMAEPLLIVPFLGLSASLWFSSQHQVIGKMYAYLSTSNPDSWYNSKHFYSWLTENQLSRLAIRLFLFSSPSIGCFIYSQLAPVTETDTTNKFMISTHDLLKPTSFIATVAIPLVVIQFEQDRHQLYRKTGFQKWAAGYTRYQYVDFLFSMTRMLYYIIIIIGIGIFFF